MAPNRRRAARSTEVVHKIDAQRAALRKLKTKGLQDEQLAVVARTTAARVRRLREGTARASGPRERLLVVFDVAYVCDLVEQQEAIAFLTAHKMPRSDLAYACGITPEGLRYWEGGRADVIKRADGRRRERLLAIARRARQAIERQPTLDFSAPKAKGARARVLGDVRPPRHASGRLSKAKIAEAQAQMRRAGLWPAAVRARKLKKLLAASGLPKVEWMRRLRVSRTVFYDFLDATKPTLMSPDVVAVVQSELRRLEEGKGAYSLRARFLTAMTVLFGPQVIVQGFPARAQAEAVGRLRRAVGWKSERNAYRYLPPYDERWWRERRLPIATVEKLEAVATQVGCII